jgi:hypothetical protein
MRLAKFSCLTDAEIVNDTFCDYRLARGKFGLLSIGFTFIRPMERVWVNIINLQSYILYHFIFQLIVESYDKGSANYYHPGLVHIKQDLCELYEGQNNLLLHLLPQLKKGFEYLLRKCPFSVKQFKEKPQLLKISKEYFFFYRIVWKCTITQ